MEAKREKKDLVSKGGAMTWRRKKRRGKEEEERKLNKEITVRGRRREKK